jgi:DNA mismatch repair ATPase MutL
MHLCNFTLTWELEFPNVRITIQKVGERLTEGEMSALVHQLFATEEPYSCPHGRPTVVKISIDELNKKIGRS